MSAPARPNRPAGNHGFTLVELLAGLAVLGVLAGLLLPALARARTRSRAAACLQGARQLQLGYQLYTDDQQGALPDNSVPPGQGSRNGPTAWIQGQVQVWGPDYAGQPARSALFPFVNDLRPFRCPASRAFVRAADGSPVPHNRSHSISAWLHGNAITNSVRGAPPMSRRLFTRLADLRHPAAVAVWLEENAVSVDNGSFGLRGDDGVPWLWHLPASRHGSGASLTFADGHAETWVWRGPVIPAANARDFPADDTRTLRPNPDANPTLALPTTLADPDRQRLIRAVPQE